MANPLQHSILAMTTTLAERLKEAATDKGIRPVDLAKATGAKASSVHKWFSGQTLNLKGKNLVLAAQRLNVSEAWLADGVGPKERGFEGGALMTISKERYDLLTGAQKLAIEEWIDQQITAYTGMAPNSKSATVA